MRSFVLRRRVTEGLWLAALCLAAETLACSRLAGQNKGPERDAWQHPEQVMDALGIGPGGMVADVGCGRGYFTFHLAKRVGREGKVYAVDVKDDELAQIRREAKEQGLTEIETITGASDDPGLPAGRLDAVLVVNAYHEMHHYNAMLAGIYRALKPGGLLALIDGSAEPGRSRDTYYSRHEMPEEVERQDAERNGFRFAREEPGFTRTDDQKKFYFLILEKPGP
jgi:predicted methyltransferase